MDILEIRVKYSMTQNLGNYTNCRPEVEVNARLAPGEESAETLIDLVDMAREQVWAIVDDELETAGESPKYYNGQLFKVARNDKRNCIVVYPASVQLPREENWKERDNWYEDGYYHAMRPETAVAAAVKLGERYPDMLMVNLANSDFNQLPPLPDPGPEPVWHQKGLSHYLRQLSIDEDSWEAVAALDHVTVDCLRKVERWTWNNPCTEEELLTHITDNLPLEDAEPADNYDDEDWDDTDD